MGKLSDDFFDELQEEYFAKTGQRSTIKKPCSEPTQKEVSDETAAAEQDSAGDEAQRSSADVPAKAGTPTEPGGAGLRKAAAAEKESPAEDKPTEEKPVAEQPAVAEVVWRKSTGAPRKAAAKEPEDVTAVQVATAQTAAVQTVAVPPVTSPLPAPVAPFPMVPLLDGKPPTEEAHQAYQQYMEWIVQAAARKLCAINSLQQQAVQPQPVIVPVGGAQIGWQLRSPPRR
jgi:hypothetical protein